MFDGSIANPLALVLLTLGLAVAAPLGFLAARRSTEPTGGFAGRFALFALAALWLALAPLNVLNHALGEPMVWLFGREGEDTGVVEYSTVLLFAAASGLCAVLAARGPLPQRLLYAVGAIGAFFIAGEEISWGQWLLHWSTPNDLYAGNLQHETNLHNFLPPVFWENAYAVAGWGVILAALAARFSSFAASIRFAPIAVFRESRYAAPLALSAGVLMQHHFFQEISEVALAAAAAYALGWIALRDLRSPAPALAAA